MANATYLKVRVDHRVRSRGAAKSSEVSLAESHTERSWADFLRSLADAREGLVAAVREVLPGPLLAQRV